ncbi:MAG: hypothetical protein UT24_C0011G0010 [Candidatus Woesebacteria bacterium GW2011_GWB1_39_12]|uniref:Uncharacterized protein n=1 Tax=Candidatus Woesebacteria bacterium GW2011_GWB1_39_12 TaxID=1618574 RepID=A0A0G0QFP4_9BACT|nr:MAG: hypothetical protein UT24_C0011G0010 [Candidatus Woesebacteria bacterium GW2011_GWB1_39_12]
MIETCWGEIGDEADATALERFDNFLESLKKNNLEIVFGEVSSIHLQFRNGLKENKFGNRICEITVAESLLNWRDFPAVELEFWGRLDICRIWFQCKQGLAPRQEYWIGSQCFLNLTNQGPMVLWQRTQLMDQFLRQLGLLNAQKLPYENVEPGKKLLTDFRRIYLQMTDHLLPSQREKLDWKYLITLGDEE